MKSETRNILLQAYAQLQRIADDLYTAADIASDNDDFDDSSLLSARADKIYEEAENLEIVISELE
ncbi:MAG: hypothetical protein H0X31_00095 [Nostocaceae cyanobacterium]|nr:hypothetical protein [Nostocaceae cyanobacterium]